MAVEPTTLIWKQEGNLVSHYLVHAHPQPGRLPRLGDLLAQDAFQHMRPFGRALTDSLTNARLTLPRVEPGDRSVRIEGLPPLIGGKGQ